MFVCNSNDTDSKYKEEHPASTLIYGEYEDYIRGLELSDADEREATGTDVSIDGLTERADNYN